MPDGDMRKGYEFTLGGLSFGSHLTRTARGCLKHIHNIVCCLKIQERDTVTQWFGMMAIFSKTCCIPSETENRTLFGRGLSSVLEALEQVPLSDTAAHQEAAIKILVRLLSLNSLPIITRQSAAKKS